MDEGLRYPWIGKRKFQEKSKKNFEIISNLWTMVGQLLIVQKTTYASYFTIIDKDEECKRSNDNNARLNHAKATIHAR